MSWSDAFPIFDDFVHADEDISRFAALFEIDRILNPRDGSHLLSTSLFVGEPVECFANNREDPGEGLQRWEPDFRQILESAQKLAGDQPGMVIRVYLAANLAGLSPQLEKVGCEVYLMKNSSDDHSPGAMWKFLAMEEEGRPVTIFDANRSKQAGSHATRTEAVLQSGLGAWRSTSGSDLGNEQYRPIKSCHFGGVGGYPMTDLMASFIAASQSGRFGSSCLFGPESKVLSGSVWPGKGFDEWFLMAVMYPRMADRGFVTFVALNRAGFNHAALLDVEYSVWAYPGSEIILFNEPPHAIGMTAHDEVKYEPRREITVRPDCDILLRDRPLWRTRGADNCPELQEIARSFEGDARELLQWAAANITSISWLDVDSTLSPIGSAAELALDRRLDAADLAVSGWFFIELDNSMTKWALSQGANPDRWVEGAAIKVPKLEGPINLWKSSAVRAVVDRHLPAVSGFRIELTIELMREAGELNLMEISASAQGWKLK